MKTIVYKNGGNVYLGKQKIQSLKFWIKKGKELNQKYLYKGYRYYNNQKDIVIVYDNDNWDKKEIEKRRKNGFLGIKKYLLS